MIKRVFSFTRLTFSVELTKWKRTDEYRYILKKEFTITKQGNICRSNMIYFHTFSAFLLDHSLNGLGNSNLRSVQEVIRVSKPATEKFKDICNDFLNLAILTKSSTLG